MPVLELPSGEMLPESAIISQYAIELNKDKGIELVPNDPVVAAKMRLEMDRFFPKYAKLLFGLRSGTDEAINDFMTKALPEYEKLCTETNGKWLMGTDEIT